MYLAYAIEGRTMSQGEIITGARLRTPRAAAVAGILFSVLLMAIILVLRTSMPANPLDAGAWLAAGSGRVALALNLVPVAGVSFLWFIGVLRDRLGMREDRFFATVFFGSGLLFLAMLFAAAAVIGAILLVFAAEPNAMLNSATLHVARALAYDLVNVYAVKMACVFMISTSTVTVFTRLAPRWMAWLGFALGLSLLVGSYYFTWSIVVLPLWVLLISIHILLDNLRGTAAAVGEATPGS
jgi:hypothetical protein